MATHAVYPLFVMWAYLVCMYFYDCSFLEEEL